MVNPAINARNGAACDNPHDDTGAFDRRDQSTLRGYRSPGLDERDPTTKRGGSKDGHHDHGHTEELEERDVPVDLVDNDRVLRPRSSRT